MLVEFVTSLGSRDAKNFDLDFSECKAGAVVDVPDSVGAELCAKDVQGRILAVPAEPPKKVKAVAPEPEIKGKADK